MAVWPVEADVQAYLRLTVVNDAAMDVALPASIAAVAARTALEEDAETVPTLARSAALLQAARWYLRQDSPSGIAGSDEFGIVRVARVDPDVEEMLSSILDWSVG